MTPGGFQYRTNVEQGGCSSGDTLSPAPQDGPQEGVPGPAGELLALGAWTVTLLLVAAAFVASGLFSVLIGKCIAEGSRDDR